MMTWQDIMGHLCVAITDAQNIRGGSTIFFPAFQDLTIKSNSFYDEVFLYNFLFSHHMSMIVRIIKHIEHPPLSHNGAKGDLSWIQKTKELGCWICMNG